MGRDGQTPIQEPSLVCDVCESRVNVPGLVCPSHVTHELALGAKRLHVRCKKLRNHVAAASSQLKTCMMLHQDFNQSERSGRLWRWKSWLQNGGGTRRPAFNESRPALLSTFESWPRSRIRFERGWAAFMLSRAACAICKFMKPVLTSARNPWTCNCLLHTVIEQDQRVQLLRRPRQNFYSLRKPRGPGIRGSWRCGFRPCGLRRFGWDQHKHCPALMQVAAPIWVICSQEIAAAARLRLEDASF